MMKMYLIAVFAVILLSNFINGDQSKYKQAELRARLAGAKSIQDALTILQGSGSKGRSAPIAPNLLKKEKETILRTAQGLNTGSHLTIEPRYGGCEPRVVCEPVPVDSTPNNNVMSVPQCIEVHRCGGCCQEPQYPCVAIAQVPVTFSPLMLVTLDDPPNYEAASPLTLMNHTKCECKCGKTEAECQSEGKTLDSNLCQCIQPRCSPDCLISSKCSVVSGSNIPRCICRRYILGQSQKFCSNRNERPNLMCTRCETVSG